MWCLCDKHTGERLVKDFIISSVGVWNKEDIHDKRLINKTVSKQLKVSDRIKEMVKNGKVTSDCIMSYNVICYYGKMKIFEN